MDIIAELTAQRDRIDRAIAALEGTTNNHHPHHRKGIKMSQSAKRAIGRAMKAAWARRKQAANLKAVRGRKKAS